MLKKKPHVLHIDAEELNALLCSRLLFLFFSKKTGD